MIQVEKIAGRLIAVCGGRDLLWKSCVNRQAILKRLADHPRPYACQLLSYPHAGHGVGALVPNVSIVRGAGALPVDGATAAANAKAVTAAWPKFLVFVLDGSR